MVKIASITFATVALVGQALAITNCTVGQFYCGYTLLNDGATYQLWERRITDALAARNQPVDSEHKTQTLFFCSAPDTVSFDEFCFSNTQPTYRCQPPSANGCGGGSTKNDCCAPQI
ncbi:hypothetical protein B0T18DRAFT_426442 [Schizothecium vesticola]|uniref:Hydrophobin n=1 Tax=Schizothecium vesticola TaxID=314040 RepID=A0AA40F6G7_9PEZI|nr:hypothetical protein B0T18DRAFT_426442 [Schizothecium vesticola]